MAYKMVHHLTHASELPHLDCMRHKQEVIIEGLVDGQSGCPPNMDPPIVVQKKILKKNSDYGMIGILYHNSRVLIHQKLDVMLGEAEIGVKKSCCRLYRKIYVSSIALHNIP
ncbi:unnamed protein product [Vicia faba]|uniref:Uncharacterized protein n=1 Tax=Vicia faba TaxID=3906 RepID=A0AAV0Z6B0_VICFA|nr:unnamed protein product [Vicia faba]